MIPVLPLRDVVVFPHMVIPLFVGRERSINALAKAMKHDQKIFLVAQKDASDNVLDDDNIYQIGTVSTILQLLKLADGTVKILVEGGPRAKAKKYVELKNYLATNISLFPDMEMDKRQVTVLIRTMLVHFEEYVKLHKKISSEVISTINDIDDPSQLADTVAANLLVGIEVQQRIFEINDIQDRFTQLIEILEEEIELLQVEKRIRGRVKNQMEKSQREYYLNEQMKAIQKELVDIDEAPNEIKFFDA